MMELLPYSLSALVAFSGVLVGAFLAMTAREEMPTGRKYFPIFQKVLLIAIAAVLLNHFSAPLIVKFAVYAALVLVLIGKHMLNFYPLLAVAFFILGQNSRELFMVSALVFLYGFPAGSMYFVRNRRASLLKTLGNASLRYAVFPVAAVALQILYNLFS